MENDKRLSRTVKLKNIQEKPITNTKITDYAPPKPVNAKNPQSN